MRLFNSLTQKIENFIPLEKSVVKMYVCGITPYDTTHLGHAFTYVFFDTLRRFLKFKGYRVDYVQNVTDVDDNILEQAKKVNKNWKDLGEFWTQRFLKDMKALNVKMSNCYVKASGSIDRIVKIVKKLIRDGVAYEKNGNIYFEVKKFKDYGQLSRYNEKQMTNLLKERGGNPQDKNKKDPLDFILWQRSKPGEPSWLGPTGIQGRPGWHIECSAMIKQYLGDQIDIHGGGHDLIFPHHESEIAQSESYTGKKPFVRFWLHVAMLYYQGEKMSKSLGNLVMVADLLKKYSANAIRWVLLSHHYREPWEFHEDEVKKAEEIIKKIKYSSSKEQSDESRSSSRQARTIKEFENYLEDDMNIPEVLKLLEKNPSREIFKLLSFSL